MFTQWRAVAVCVLAYQLECQKGCKSLNEYVGGPEGWTALASVVIAVLTGVYVWSAIGMWGRIKQQAELMEGQLGELKTQAAEMQRQTNLLDESVKIAKSSADIAVGMTLPKLVIHELSGANQGVALVSAMLQLPKIKLVIQNYGKTPALLRYWSILFTCEDMPEIPEYEGQPGCGIVLPHEVIQPGTPYTLTVVHSWNRQVFEIDDVMAIIERRKKLWAYGFVCYGDIFGNPIQRFKFCALALNVDQFGIDWHTGFFKGYAGTEQAPSPTISSPIPPHPAEQQDEENPN